MRKKKSFNDLVTQVNKVIGEKETGQNTSEVQAEEISLLKSDLNFLRSQINCQLQHTLSQRTMQSQESLWIHNIPIHEKDDENREN